MTPTQGNCYHREYVATSAAGRLINGSIPIPYNGRLYWPFSDDGRMLSQNEWSLLTDEELAVCCPVVQRPLEQTVPELQQQLKTLQAAVTRHAMQLTELTMQLTTAQLKIETLELEAQCLRNELAQMRQPLWKAVWEGWKSIGRSFAR